jgi:hypothetical protein
MLRKHWKYQNPNAESRMPSKRQLLFLYELALAVGGANQDGSRLSLDAQPRVSTPYGTITYPGRLTIVNAEFR